MAANNQGIAHFLAGNMVACHRQDAHIAVTFDQFSTEPRQCKRCAAKWARLQAKREARAAEQRLFVEGCK